MLTRASLAALDRDDPLASFRDEFALPSGVVYLDGNSLGAMPKAALERARTLLAQQWAQGLVRSWNTHGWYEAPRRIGAKIAGLIGAAPDEVLCADATGINLFKALAVALALRPQRTILVLEGSNFPTDNYVAQGLVAQLGDRHRIRFVERDALAEAIDEEVAAVCLTHVHYRTGHVHDMADITARAHAAGALAIWDLCHSAGAMPVAVNAAQADVAVGCTYKYLNGGPGAPAYIFLARRHHGRALQPLTGWWGHQDPFAFARDYAPAPGVAQMATGTQPVISMLLAEVGIDLMARADMQLVREKSLRMGDLFIELVESRCRGYDLEVLSPRDGARRGSHVALAHREAWPIMQALIDRGVIGDYREPGALRFGFAPLYNRYTDVWDAVEALRDVLATRSWDAPRYRRRHAVT